MKTLERKGFIRCNILMLFFYTHKLHLKNLYGEKNMCTLCASSFLFALIILTHTNLPEILMKKYKHQECLISEYESATLWGKNPNILHK